MAREKKTTLYTFFKQEKHIIYIALAVTTLALTAAISPEIEENLSKEDGWIENTTTLVLLATTALGLFSISKQILGKKALIFVSLASFLAFLSEISFGERLFDLDMPHAGGKELDGVHDLLHMFQKIYSVNYNYHPTETLIVSACLLTVTAFLSHAGRSRLLQLNTYLKTLKIRSIIIYSAALAAAAQAFDLDIITHENHRILEEMLELLAALCLAGTVFKLKSLNHSNAK